MIRKLSLLLWGRRKKKAMTDAVPKAVKARSAACARAQEPRTAGEQLSSPPCTLSVCIYVRIIFHLHENQLTSTNICARARARAAYQRASSASSAPNAIHNSAHCLNEVPYVILCAVMARNARRVAGHLFDILQNRLQRRDHLPNAHHIVLRHCRRLKTVHIHSFIQQNI